MSCIKCMSSNKYSVCRPFTKNKEKIKKLKKKQAIRDIFIKTNYTKPVFSMIWRIEILKIYQKEQLMIKHYVSKYLRYYTTFKVRTFASLFYKINAFLQKNLPLVLDCRQSRYSLKIYNIHIFFSILGVVFAVPLLFTKAPASCGK